MKYLGAKLFTWLQGAEFYVDFHREGLVLIPDVREGKWIDIGSGPGLLTRLASLKGYDAIGIDSNIFMIREAQKIARDMKSKATFEVRDAYRTPQHSADVVSASSLIAAVEDKVGVFNALFDVVKPGGILIIFEPTNLLTPSAVNIQIKNGLRGKRIFMLRLWAYARRSRVTNPDIFSSPEIEKIEYTPLCRGFVGMWQIQKKNAPIFT